MHRRYYHRDAHRGRNRNLYRRSGWCDDCEGETVALFVAYSKATVPELYCERCDIPIASKVEFTPPNNPGQSLPTPSGNPFTHAP